MAKKVKKVSASQDPPFKTQAFTFPQSILQLPTALPSTNDGNTQIDLRLYKSKFGSIIPHQIFKIDNFLTELQCTELIKKIEQQLPMETTPLIKSKYYAARVNDRTSIKDPKSALLFYRYFKSLIDFKILNGDGDDDLKWISEEMKGMTGFNDNLRMYRYKEGHYFGKHYDESNIVPGLGSTKWTLLIYLNGVSSSDRKLVGGSTTFHNHEAQKGESKVINVEPECGMALFHKHGDDCLLHEGEVVKAGEKWIFRTDVVFK